ncbi:MAG: sigma-54 dependent transcriptional regulator [Bacteroidetes bacterium]|nr:sigma-54 dependent transcriptional regulator [Bacteroidota bacterium]
MKSNKNIVVIEDDPLVNDTITGILDEKYENIITFTDAAEAIEKLYTINPDLILLDIFLGYHNGIEILEQLNREGWKKPVIMMTAYSDVKLAVKAMKLGAKDFIVKPLDLEQLEMVVATELKNAENETFVEIMKETNAFPIIKASNIIGESEGMQKAMRMAKILANADDTTVLITGESGTGKELMAQYIHNNSARAKAPFIAINCGSIPKDLAENELFGHEKGAFTGATSEKEGKKGKFEQAQHGTILLDEIGELSLELQVKLLRVLQERKFYRLGGSKEVAIDVRVIAATNKNLETEIDNGTFRDDLYWRLNVANIPLPPLRERGEDIITLASAFLIEFGKKFGRNIKGFSTDAANILMSHSWKGNIRELRNVIERIVLLHENNKIIQKEELAFIKSPTHVQTSKTTSIEIPDRGHYLQISKNGAKMSDVVKDLIIKTLKLTGGNQVAATKLLDTTRARLRYKIEQYGIITEKVVE